MAETITFKKTFTLGNDLTVNRMGFGAMRITGEGIWGPPKDKDEAIRVLQRTVELGINFIDTADSYGPNISEELIAEALYPYPKDLVIATKGGLTRTGPNVWPINAHPDYLQKALEGSLKRLKQDRIDLYQLHRVDPEVPYENGLSEVTIDQIRKAQEYFEVVSVQNKYSVDFRTKWEEELKFCEDNNMAFIPWNPINAGNVGAINKLQEIGDKYDASAHQIALSWLLHHSPNILLIPGTSKVKHLEENYEAASIALSEEDINELNQLKQSEK
jgi:aryl-alcohol dehydrogenase-like predicted oxidoreductase